MKANRLLVAVASILLLTGCTGVHTLTKTDIANSPTVELKQNNFHVVKHVSSSASATYVFGIGGLSKKALKQNAVADMISKANLEGSQVVINVTTKVSRKIYTPIFVKEIVTAYGTVVEFDSPAYEYTTQLNK